MKHDYARDMDPRQGVGKRFWDAAQATGLPCSPSIRLWIVPKQAKVRADRRDLVVVVVLAYPGPGLVGRAVVGVGEPGAATERLAGALDLPTSEPARRRRTRG